MTDDVSAFAEDFTDEDFEGDPEDYTPGPDDPEDLDDDKDLEETLQEKGVL